MKNKSIEFAPFVEAWTNVSCQYFPNEGRSGHTWTVPIFHL